MKWIDTDRHLPYENEMVVGVKLHLGKNFQRIVFITGERGRDGNLIWINPETKKRMDGQPDYWARLNEPPVKGAKDDVV